MLHYKTGWGVLYLFHRDGHSALLRARHLERHRRWAITRSTLLLLPLNFRRVTVTEETSEVPIYPFMHERQTQYPSCAS